jgi:hypothetical protein
MLIPEICSEHSVGHCGLTFNHVKSVATVMKRIIISNYSYNNICYEHMIDMLLTLNTIDEFLITRFVDAKMVHYKDPIPPSDISLLKSNDWLYKHICILLS